MKRLVTGAGECSRAIQKPILVSKRNFDRKAGNVVKKKTFTSKCVSMRINSQKLLHIVVIFSQKP